MENNWSFIKKIGFLFLFAYLVLYTNSNQFIFSFLIEPIWVKVVPWLADLMGYDSILRTAPNGSGDTTYDFFRMLLFAVLAGIVALGLVIADRKRNNYLTLLAWLVVLIRYYLAYQMIFYGILKLFYLQFSFPSPERLDQTLGDFSPMGLLWTFMGYSQGYTMFTGALEFIGGILLLSRYTTTLGALTTFGVMLNVMMLNYCYDVPVKLLSTHLVLMALFLIVLDCKRLLRFFITNKQVEPNMLPDIMPEKIRKAKNIIKWLLIALWLGLSFYGRYNIAQKHSRKKSDYGKYHVAKFDRYDDNLVKKNIQRPDKDWYTLYPTRNNKAILKTISGKSIRYTFKPDIARQKVSIGESKQPDSLLSELNYKQLASDSLHIYGKYQGDSLDIILKKEPSGDYLLIKRGFNWVNETPFNR